MENLWRNEGGRLVCRWSEVGNRKRFHPDWSDNRSGRAHEKRPPDALDFRKLSPFGGRDWYRFGRS